MRNIKQISRASWRFLLPFLYVQLVVGAAVAEDAIVIDLQTRDIVYSPLNDTIYASVPNASPTNPNSLTPINPNTGALGAPIAIGFEPGRISISSDGSMIHASFADNVGVQSLSIPDLTLGYTFFISGGPKVRDMRAIPDRPTAVLVSTYYPGFSPPATGTAVWQDGVKLANVVGTGLGSGGPDVITVDAVDGSKGYGYQNTVSSYTNKTRYPAIPTGICISTKTELIPVAVAHCRVL